jgi:hypothetical protein
MNEAGAREPQPEDLRMAYQEVCRSHTAITDFRAKLLALLPVATGVGVGALVSSSNGRLAGIEPGVLIAVGVFGALVTFGLFLYEARQIDICKQLRNHGSWLENELNIGPGQFGGRRDRLYLRAIYSTKTRKYRDDLLAHAEKREELSEAGPEGHGGSGPFRIPFIGAEAAGNVVYHVVFLAWLVLPCSVLFICFAREPALTSPRRRT